VEPGVTGGSSPGAVAAAHFGLSMVLMVASVFLMQPTLVGTAVCGE